MASLDLRKFNLGTTNIKTFETKKLAKQYPIPHLAYIKEAANRFWLFYVIVRKSTDGSFSIMLNDGTFMEVPEINLVANKTYSA